MADAGGPSPESRVPSPESKRPNGVVRGAGIETLDFGLETRDWPRRDGAAKVGMAHAYTPGLRVAERLTLRKRRILPIPGDVLVAAGDRVRSDTVVARTLLPGKVHLVNVVNQLGIAPEEIRGFMRAREGARVEQGQPLAETRPLIRWFQTRVPSPVTGTVESVSEVTGQVLVRELPQPLELLAYLDGHVVETIPDQGATVETVCAFVQGIFGAGGETTGGIALAAAGPDEPLAPDRLDPQHAGKIVVGGAYADGAALRRAAAVGVRALVVGGIDDGDLRDLLGHDLGVAITGTEPIPFTLILTEGFGRIAMAHRTFDLFGRFQGRPACCSGATQIRAGVIRPEVIIPHPDEGAAAPAAAAERGGLAVGDPIRIIRGPHFGELATVAELPHELEKIPTESLVRVLRAKLPDGSVITVPRANVEILET